MRHLLSILCLLAAATAHAQTIKSLGYNTTNGQVVAATNVVWTNAFSFSTNTVAAQVRTNLGLGGAWLTNTDTTNFRTAVGVARAPIWAYKTANQTNDSTNLVSDDALTFTAQANTKYAVELFLLFNVRTNAATENHLIDGKINAPNSQLYGSWKWIDGPSVLETHASVTNRSQLFQPYSLPLSASMLHRFVVVAPTNTNSAVTFEWGKNAGLTNAGDVVIEAGSYIKAEVIE